MEEKGADGDGLINCGYLAWVIAVPVLSQTRS